MKCNYCDFVWEDEEEYGKHLNATHTKCFYCSTVFNNDEFDDESDVAYNKLDNNTFIFEGKTSLNDFCKITNTDIALFDSVKGESESLGGLVLELNTKLPSAGEKIRLGQFVFTVVAVDQKRIKRLRVYIKSDKSNVAGFED